jgi:lipoprotein NlpI
MISTFALFVFILAQEPDAREHVKRGRSLDAMDKHAEAAAEFRKAIDLDSRLADAYHLLGLSLFKMAKVADSIAAFDKYIELNPKAKVSHWQRGISYYYAGRYDDGRAQFEGYQTFDSNDVENAVWRYLCMARKDGVAKARADLLKIGNDKRVPMRQIYDLFAGQLKPDDVLAAARAGEPGKEQLNRQLFYAHLYLGLYYETEGDRQRALEHLNRATDEHRMGHYMWDVARVHRDILRKK